MFGWICAPIGNTYGWKCVRVEAIPIIIITAIIIMIITAIIITIPAVIIIMIPATIIIIIITRSVASWSLALWFVFVIPWSPLVPWSSRRRLGIEYTVFNLSTDGLF